MPQVEVLYASGGQVPEDVLLSLRGMLPRIVSAVLHVDKKGMRLAPKDIGVTFHEAGQYDVLTHTVQIKISANYYPERLEGLQEVRTPQIVREIQPLIPPGMSFYVWPFTGQAAFVEARGTGGIKQKKVAILNVGEWGEVTRDEYDDIARYLLKDLLREGVDVIALKEVPESPDDYSSLIFITRGMLPEARKLKVAFPEKTVILFTGLVNPGDDAEGVIPIWKGEQGYVQTIVRLVQQ